MRWIACLLLALGCAARARGEASLTAEPVRVYSVVRVNVTNQGWDFFRPWSKRNPFSRRAVGAVLPGHHVIVTAELVANASYIEFETPEGGLKAPASVEAVDYEANLALLSTEDPKFLDAFKPLELSGASVGDTLAVLQLETNGALLSTRGPLTNAEVSHYPIDDSQLLVYHLTAALQFREAAFTLPVVKDDKLVGIVMRYDPQSTSSDIIPAPVIEHFLRAAGLHPYPGFPRAGVSFASTRDPQLRRYAGLTSQFKGGVYVTDVQNGGPAGVAGVEPGDILLRVDNESVDQDGNYSDPAYGKISVSHLLSTRHYNGDHVNFSILRKGENKSLTVELTHRSPEQFTIEPYVIDRAPKFYIFGGLILEELSRQYLKEWGPEWVKKAPGDLVYLERHQSELFPDNTGKVVFLSRVLPSDTTLGYEELHHLVVEKIDGVAIHSLADVPKAVSQVANGLHKIEFSSDPAAIYLDASQVKTSEQVLTKVYRLPYLSRLD